MFSIEQRQIPSFIRLNAKSTNKFYWVILRVKYRQTCVIYFFFVQFSLVFVFKHSFILNYYTYKHISRFKEKNKWKYSFPKRDFIRYNHKPWNKVKVNALVYYYVKCDTVCHHCCYFKFTWHVESGDANLNIL